MRPTSVTVSTISASPLIPLDNTLSTANIGAVVDFNSAAATVTFSVEHTYDDLMQVKYATISRSTTTVTVTTVAAHQLSTGDVVVVRNANARTGAAGLDGTYTVTVTSTTAFTYTSGTSGTVSTTAGIEVTLLRMQVSSQFSAKTAATEGSFTVPITALRLNVSAIAAGAITLTVVQGRK